MKTNTFLVWNNDKNEGLYVRVPFCDRSLQILKELNIEDTSDYNKVIEQLEKQGYKAGMFLLTYYSGDDSRSIFKQLRTLLREV